MPTRGIATRLSVEIFQPQYFFQPLRLDSHLPYILPQQNTEEDMVTLFATECLQRSIVFNPSPLRGPPLSLRAEEDMITSSIPFASWCIFAPLPEGTVANKREQSYAGIDYAEREQLGR